MEQKSVLIMRIIECTYYATSIATKCPTIKDCNKASRFRRGKKIIVVPIALRVDLSVFISASSDAIVCVY